MKVFLFVVFLGGGLLASEGTGLPLISDMLKSSNAEEAKSKEEKATFPRPLNAVETRMDVTDLLPGGAYFYLEMPSGKQMGEAYGTTAVADVLGSKGMGRFFAENPFDLETMMSDLPAEYSKPGIVTMMRTFISLVKAFVESHGLVSLSAYPGENDVPVLLFQADIGRDRKAAHEKLQALVLVARSKSNELNLQKAKHNDDYIEVLRIGRKDQGLELGYGFIRNHLVISTDGSFLRRLSLRASSKNFSNSLADSVEGGGLGSKTAPQSQFRGFIDIFTLLEAAVANKLPEAGATLSSYQGVMNRAPIYYDLQIKDKGILEHITLSGASTKGDATVMSRLKAIGRQDDGFSLDSLRTIKLMPYNPDSFYAANVSCDDLAALLRDSRFIRQARASLSANLGDVISALQVVFASLGENPSANLGNEIGLALQEESSSLDKGSWIVAIPLTNTGTVAGAIASGGSPMKKVSGIEVYSRAEELNSSDPAWAVFAQTDTTFRNLGFSFLVITSSGREMERTIDSIIGGRAVLATNKDFKHQARRLADARMIFGYGNVLKEVQSNYFQLPSFVKELYPRITGLHSLPQLTSMTRHLFGMTSSLAVTDSGDFRLSSWSPVGNVPSMVAKVLLAGPRMVRLKEEWQLLRARKHLAELNLALQEYATQYGHYPAAIHGEIGRQALVSLLPRHLTLDTLLTSSVAVEEFGSVQEALKKSYIYVPGLLPSEVPESVILYNSKPFHYHYSDETKRVYESCRLVLSLDGRITTYSEQEFKNSILPTIKNRQ